MLSYFRIGLFWHLCTGFLLFLYLAYTGKLGGPPLLPVVAISLLSLAIIFLVADYSKLFLALSLCLPLSVNTPFIKEQLNIIFPSELLIGTLTLLFWLKMITQRQIDLSLLKHPVSISIIIYFLSIFLSSLFSSIPLVSIKQTIVQFSYLTVFYFLAGKSMQESAKKLSWSILLYALALTLVIFIIWNNHAGYGLTKETSGFATKPFFNDHTIYSACLSLILPLLILFSIRPDFLGLNSVWRIGFIFLSLLFLAAIYLSFSRAAWVGLAGTLVFLGLILARIRFGQLMVLLLAATVIILIRIDPILWKMKQIQADSNASFVTLQEQTESIFSLKNDQSNAERINRWSCAIRMFKDNPWVGFGPGTYQFMYLDYQLESEMTPLSVTTTFDIPEGRGGNAHSEFLLALSEGGIFLFLSFLLIVLLTIRTGLRLVNHASEKPVRWMAAALLLGLFTYLIHGNFNNFLDTDKAAFLFWGFIAFLVVLDIRQRTLQS